MTDEVALDADPTPTRSTGIALALWGAIGLLAAFTLAVERYRLLENPDGRLSCDLSPLLSCGSVMVTDQAQLLGFPNPLLGIGAFAVVITLGVQVAAGLRLPPWLLTGLAAGAVLGLVLVGWLSFQSIYRIGALCPWCMVVWAVTIPIAVWTVALALRAAGPTESAGRLLWDFRVLVTMLVYLVLLVQILVHFWDYWSTLL